jgi:solute carrier family 32 (vesicular inhibitory amino acid transporter)
MYSSNSTPREETPLLQETSNGITLISSPARTEDDDSVESLKLWHELDEPWPATFERSISLLASPVIHAQEVVLYTKSPKPGSTPLALARRRNLDKGVYTPEHGVLPPLRSTSIDEEDNFVKGVNKAQSLDFASKIDVNRVQKDQAIKAKKAKEYRDKILQQHKIEEGTAGTKKAGKQKGHEIPIKEGKSTFTQCVFNLANILMGVGLLGLPYVFKSAGWYGGFFCLSSFGLITWRTSILIGRELNGDPRPASRFVDSPFKSPLMPGSAPEARLLPPIHSFPDIARVAFGSKGCLILSVILYFELFSCICVFFVAIGDHLHNLFPSISVAMHMAIVSVISIVPTILLHTPALLSYLSMVGTLATITVVSSVILAACLYGDLAPQVAKNEGIVTDEPYHIYWRPQGLAVAFGLVAYCFSGHAIVPAIYTSMNNPQDFEGMVTATYVVVVSACMAVAIAGYYMFGDMVADQVTLSMEQHIASAPSAMDTLSWLMVLTAFSKVTLTMFPLSLGMEEIVAPFLTSDRLVVIASMSIKFILTGLALFTAICVPSFSFLCALVGMICTMSVSVIFPAAAHIKMFGSRLPWWELALDYLFVFVGVVMAVVGTACAL